MISRQLVINLVINTLIFKHSDQEFKSREVAQPQKNNVISGFMINLVFSTLIFIDASAIRRLEWYTNNNTMHARVSFLLSKYAQKHLIYVYYSVYRNFHD